jgi:hypothetical protein
LLGKPLATNHSTAEGMHREVRPASKISQHIPNTRYVRFSLKPVGIPIVITSTRVRGYQTLVLSTLLISC